MYFKIEGCCFSENIYKEIEAITNYGVLFFKDVEYDEKNKLIRIPIERYKIKNTKQAFFRMRTSYNYDKYSKLKSLIVVKNVSECIIENYLVDSQTDKIHLLFGMNVNPKTKKIYIGSVEEDRGRTCYSIELKVSEINIEINDLESGTL